VNLDTFTYYVLTAGIMCAGYVPFPLSPRNPPAAILHLLQSTGARHLLVSSDPGIQRLVEGLTNAFNAYHNAASRGGSVPTTPLSPAPPPWLLNTGSGLISPASPMSLSGVIWPPPAPDPLQFFPVPTFDYLFDGYDESFEPTKPVLHPPSDGLVIIGHSSGTLNHVS
jgi:acyl-CoA synthetase (AMP-forming)/AMP-acid ligase II